MFDVAIENRTPFITATNVQLDNDGQEILLVVMSGTFRATDDGGGLDLASEQVPISLGDEPFGEPGKSSIRAESDIALLKPKVDVVVNGTAYAPGGDPVPEVMVGLQMADIRKTLRVSGDRVSAGVPARPFTRMPIVYERAFGGTAEDGDVFVENPVGVGYRNARSADPRVATAVPNIEYPDRPTRSRGDHVAPAGFGVISRNWATRAAFAGTYDQAWIDTVWPLPPSDFDPRFNQAAPLDQQTQVVRGGEPVVLLNMTPAGMWRFQLPRLDVPIHVIFEDRIEPRETRVDTVVIDAERRTVTLKVRISLKRIRNAPRLQAIAYGHVSRAWLKAQQKRKIYLSAGNGIVPGRATFHL